MPQKNKSWNIYVEKYIFHRSAELKQTFFAAPRDFLKQMISPWTSTLHHFHLALGMFWGVIIVRPKSLNTIKQLIKSSVSDFLLRKSRSMCVIIIYWLGRCVFPFCWLLQTSSSRSRRCEPREREVEVIKMFIIKKLSIQLEKNGLLKTCCTSSSSVCPYASKVSKCFRNWGFSLIVSKRLITFVPFWL